MAKKSKLELIMELSDKLFNNKLSQVQAKLSNATDKMEGKLKHFNMTQIKIFKGIGEAFDPVKINQAFELFDSVSEKMDFTKDINKTKLALQQMDVKNIDEVSGKIHEISKVFNEDSIEIAKAANAMTKQIGGSFESNLALLQSGYEKGANLNGDMLDQFKEYGPQIRELGLNASQVLAIMASAGKEGLFSDKAIDSIKEANLSLKEMGPTQVDALKGIGIAVKDLAGKTSFEAVQMISKAMAGATAQAKQLALTDIFKGAGEDAGMGFILGLGSMDLDPNNLESFQAMDAGMNTWLARFESKIADTMGSLPIQDIAAFTMTIMGMISILTTLNGVLPLTTLLTGAFGFVISNIGLIAMIGLVIMAIKYFDDWGATVLLFMGPIGRLIMAFKLIYDHWDSIVQAFKDDGILGGLARIGEVLMDVILLPLQQILELLANIDPTGLAQKGADAVKEFRNGHGLIKGAEGGTIGNADPNDPLGLNPKPNPWGTPAAAVSPLLKAPVLDGKIVTTGGKKDKKQGSDVSKVAGQANQVRNVTIQIDSFNKGGINVSQSAFSGMSKDDLEAWMKEMFRRVIINAETA